MLQCPARMLLPGLLQRALVSCNNGLICRELQTGAALCASSSGKSTYNVPEGHHGSDLSSTACHIGLGRRRDLTMRQDLRLWQGEQQYTLAQVFQASAAVGAVAMPGRLCLSICERRWLPCREQKHCW
jgi:hypothetical protein